jgi:transglutaminase-like putative cysteine protease
LVVILTLLIPALVDGLGRPGTELTEGGGEGDVASPYWGFSDRMDTSARGELGDQEMMRVWADRPDFWRGQTFDRWDGRYWTASDTTTVRLEAQNPMRPVPGVGDVGVSTVSEATVSSSQTYELVGAGTDVVFAAYRPVELVSPQWSWSRISDGSILSDWMPAGSVYRVESERIAVTPDLLRQHDPAAADLAPVMADRFLDDGAVTDRVRALAQEITADAPSTYDKIRGLEAWMGENIEYTRDIPVPPEGADAVEQLLFVDRAGFCEQIGTALTMMMRSLGVPSRLAVGYVTGEQVGDDEYLVRAEDAHAWVEIWFPGLGWQGFDPTASVPLAGESSANDIGIPWKAIGVAALALALIVGAQWWWRRRQARRDELDIGSDGPQRPPSILTTALTDEGARRGVERRSDETVQELAQRVVAEARGDDRFVRVAELATRASYGPVPIAPEDERQALDVIADLGREELVPSGPPPPNS